MDKKKIGKTQFTLGLIILILGILGVVATGIYYKQSMKHNEEIFKNDLSGLIWRNQNTNATEIEINMEGIAIQNEYNTNKEHASTTSTILFSSLSLLIIISILLITQGAINKKTK